jgi:hypothetical protein
MNKKNDDQIEIKEHKWSFSTATIISALLFTITVCFIGGELWSITKTGISNNSNDFKAVKLQLDSVKKHQIKQDEKISDIFMQQIKQGKKQDKQTDVIKDILTNVNINKELSLGILGKLTTYNQPYKPLLYAPDSSKKNFCFHNQK